MRCVAGGADRTPFCCVTGKPRQSMPEPRNLQSKVKALMRKIEAMTIDSASDEVLAAELMRGNSTSPKETSMAPNLNFVIRDVTHASRRCIQKPEKSDDYLHEIVGTLFTNRSSITQRIEHSLVWREQFAKHVQEVDDQVGNGVKNVKAAKHRHESSAKPRGRFVLYMDAYIVLAQYWRL